MTAIAYRDGVMAADGLETSGGIVTSTSARKIARREDGALIGSAGDAVSCERLIKAFLAHELRHIEPTRDKENPYAAIIVEPDGTLYRVTELGMAKVTPAPFYTEGCAYQILTGALAAGATAQEAVCIAAEWDTRVGGDIQVERLDGAGADPRSHRG